MLRSDLPRLGREPARLGDDRRVPRASALHEGECPGEQRHHERRRDDGEQGPQATRPALCGPQLALLGVEARLQELALVRVRAAARRANSAAAARRGPR